MGDLLYYVFIAKLGCCISVYCTAVCWQMGEICWIDRVKEAADSYISIAKIRR